MKDRNQINCKKTLNIWEIHSGPSKKTIHDFHNLMATLSNNKLCVSDDYGTSEKLKIRRLFRTASNTEDQ